MNISGIPKAFNITIGIPAKYGFFITLAIMVAITVIIVPIIASNSDDVIILTIKQPMLRPSMADGIIIGNNIKASPGLIWKKGWVASPPNGNVIAIYNAAIIPLVAIAFDVIFNFYLGFLFFEGVPTPLFFSILSFLLFLDKVLHL